VFLWRMAQHLFHSAFTPKTELSELWFIYVTLNLGNVTLQRWLLNKASKHNLAHLRFACTEAKSWWPQGLNRLPREGTPQWLPLEGSLTSGGGHTWGSRKGRKPERANSS
jgi:hypothetical protein